MAELEKFTLRLKPNHRWRAQPGYTVFVADRGAVRFEIPQDWVVIPEPDSIKFYNKQPPDDDCRLQLSVIYIPADFDWGDVTLAQLAEDTLSGHSEDVISRGRVVSLKRGDMDIAWAESKLMDPIENRESRSRSCFAHRKHVQAIMTFDYWPEDAKRFLPAWNAMLQTLHMAEYIDDPRLGPD